MPPLTEAAALLRPFPLFAAVALLAGCARVPDLGPRPELRSAALLASSQTLAGTGAWPDGRWWTALGDRQLDMLIDEALRQSPDVAVAAARVHNADALAGEARAARSPTLDARGTAGGVVTSQNLGIPPQFVPNGIRDTGQVALSGTFDLDLWGRNRAALAAATSEATAARADVAQAAALLGGSIAATYAELAQYHLERDVAVRALAIRQGTTTLTADRVRAGLDTQGSLSAAQARLAAARTDIATLDETIALTQHRLATLVGAGPDRGLAIARPALRASTSGIPANAGIELVARRPDLIAARLRAEATADRIKVARTAFYPNISIGALIGLQALGLGKVVDSGSLYGNVGPAISLPIFDGGRIAARYRGARASYDVAVAQYDATLLRALQEVADAATSLRAVDVRLTETRQALVAANDASRIARLRYRAGLSNQLPVLNAEDNEIPLRRAVADLEARRIALDVALARALSGGTDNAGLAQRAVTR